MNKPGQRIVVVTGASAGVGRAIAIEFAKCGDSIALVARGKSGLDAAAAEVIANGGRAFVVTADVSDNAAVEAAAQQIEDALGPIDVWVNVAFSSVFAPFTEIEPEEYERTTMVSYLGFVNGTRAALKRMIPRDSGVVIQIGSALGYRGIPLQSAYCGAKHAIQGFNESLRTELLHSKSKVRTTLVVLPAVNTPQFDWVLSRLPKKPQPVPPIFQPEVIARVAVKAAVKKRREWWVGGSTVATLVANKFVPGLLDHYLARTGYKSQQTNTEKKPDRPVNLFKPMDEDSDFGTHGSFDRQSKSRSFQVVLSEHHDLIAAAGMAAGGILVGRRLSKR